MRIAVYGKGGIGKSTISANLSAALADQGRRVLQIGCDPKQDSTRLLLGGTPTRTVLDYLRRTPPGEQQLGEVIQAGWQGVDCVEAGGPEPGVGCAGRGILSAFSLLDRLGCRWSDYEVIVYDVLGDVVCGGFAVPLRKGFAEAVLIVTSEEFMSLYAANNILRGLANMDQGEPRPVGLILNRREREADTSGVTRFAAAVGVPVVQVLPRSRRFALAESRAQTMLAAFPDSPEAGIFRQLARTAVNPPPSDPHPLSDEELERVVLGRTGPAGPRRLPLQPVPATSIPPTAASPGDQPAAGRYLSKSLLTREPLHGCAFTGAVNTLTQIGDAVTVAHGPSSCANIAASTMRSAGLATLRLHGVAVPEQLAPALVSTRMSDLTLIHGGTDALRAGLQQAASHQPEAIFVTTTCPAGVVGDDLGQVIAEQHSLRRPVLAISTDGDIEGDYLQGVINACVEGAGALIDPRVAPAEDCVNVVAEKNIALNADLNFAEMERLLGMLGLRVNTRFVRRTSVAALHDYLRAPLNLLAYGDHLGQVLRSFLTGTFGCRFAENPFPSGFHETERWLREIAGFFDRAALAERALEVMRAEYTAGIARLRPRLAGSRLMLVTYNHDVDWILETAFDLDIEVVKVGIVDYSQDGVHRTRYADRVTAQTGYRPEQRAADIAALRPDLCLGNYQSPGLPQTTHYDTIPMCPDAGHLGGLALARRWQRLLDAPLIEGWRGDEARLLGPGAGRPARPGALR